MLNLLRTFAVFIAAYIATAVLAPVVASPYERAAQNLSYEETPGRGMAVPSSAEGLEFHPSTKGMISMSTTVHPSSDKNASGEKAQRYRSYDALRDDLYTIATQIPEGPALQRVYRLANAKHESRASQWVAIVRAVQEELATVAPPTRAEKNIEEFRRDMRPKLWATSGTPIDCMEGPNRPHWASRAQDQISHDVGDKVTCRTEMSWRSESISIPLFDKYYGELGANGDFESARVMADVRQKVGQSMPNIAFERHGFKLGDNGKAVPIKGVDRYTLSIDEASNLARGLLLLIDLATGASDDLGGA